jgi:putative spermidine/putrescine transport system ATP-binding protein
VRTDHLKLGRLNGRLPPGALAATVRDVEYQGTHVEIGLAGETTGDLVASVREEDFFADPIAPGDKVAISWADRDAHKLSS